MNFEDVRLISKKYNESYAKEFSKKSAEKTFLSPIGLSIIPTTNIDEDQIRFTPQEEKDYFKALHFIKYKISVEIKLDSPWINKYIILYEQIRNKIICANMKLLHKCISLTSIQMDEESLIDAGNIALIDAVDNFDPWRGFNFSTYAMHCMFRRFMRESKKTSLIPIEQGVDPSDNLKNIPTKRQDEKMEYLKERLRVYLDNRVNGLTAQDIDILTMRFRLDDPYGKKLTLRETSEKYGMSKERIRQLQNTAILKLKQAFNDNKVFG